jgi:predicted O-linked N-acetylglucosamine transferase (SPINDLY family)
LIFALNFDPTANAADQQAERAAWADRHASRFISTIRGHDNDRDPQRRLRIGYVSSHFCRGAATSAFGSVIADHDSDRIEVICYSDTAHEDAVTQRLVERADTWHRTAGLHDDALADLIRADRIDILVDLVGHMSGHRLLVFARKPAPIQVTAWGAANGTGLRTVDYLFADPVLAPPETRKLLTEEIIDLPNFIGLWLPQSVPEPNSLPMRSRGRITFGSFNRLDKVQEPVLASWAAILRTVAGSRLVLKDRTLIDSTQQARILTAFAAHGVAPDRITLLRWADASEPYQAYYDIDLALDPFPHSGGVTTLEALWMGVPVVTCIGSTIPSRLTAASLSALGLADFIAPDVEAYIRLAVAKARDTDGLSGLRASLRQRVAGSDFGNPVRYARAIEAVYRSIWQRWCATIG